MSNTYDKNNIVYSEDTNFNTLRNDLYTKLVNLSTRKSAINNNDKSGFQHYSAPRTISSTIAETQNTRINDDPCVNPLATIKHLIINNYMKVTGHITAANNIKNDNNEYITHLNDYYEIVNYWANGTDSSDHRCNGACTGFCYLTCSGGNKGTVSHGSSHCSNCTGKCITGCSTACGSGNCKDGCTGGCHYKCSGGETGEVLPT